MLDLKSVEKGGPFLMVRNEVDVTVEFLHDEFTDDKSKAYAVGVDLLLFILNWSKKFE